ncbi:MAG: ferrous iron transport protein A [archaeon GB-1867-097]|nr:ferrous iron transport protein A [Candidatus Verstraetearchaeota archaeon]MCS7374882.1 ferrous iron transport protein A [Candidatus Culexmicrobium thermophilum]MCS7384779.1 ferrous iron transport protein A [Candidatus Culexmicrobium thermophilum]
MYMYRPSRIIPLAMLPEGVRGIIVKIIGGRGLVRRLTEMGFTPGIEVTVLKSSFQGPILAVIRGSRIVIGRGVAMKILVEVGG